MLCQQKPAAAGGLQFSMICRLLLTIKTCLRALTQSLISTCLLSMQLCSLQAQSDATA